jgi:hypothetical protein
MAAVTIDPSDEACQTIVSRINSGSGSTYTLPTPATYGMVLIDEVEKVTGLLVDVIHQDQTQLNETLDIEDRSSHFLIVWVRDKLPNITQPEIASRMLVLRKIYQRLNNFDSANGRVKVWDCGYTDTTDPNRDENPNKKALLEQGYFKAFIKLRVEVEAP